MRSWIAGVVLAVYLLIIGGFVIWAVVSKTDSPVADATASGAVTATRTLPVNHLIRDDDLEGADTTDLVGRYVAKPIARGATVAEADVGATPVLDATEDALLAVPLAGAVAESGKANAGASVLLCNGDTKLAAAIVIAQLCSGDGNSAACRVLLTPPSGTPPIAPASLRAAISTCALAPAEGADRPK